MILKTTMLVDQFCSSYNGDATNNPENILDDYIVDDDDEHSCIVEAASRWDTARWVLLRLDHA